MQIEVAVVVHVAERHSGSFRESLWQPRIRAKDTGHVREGQSVISKEATLAIRLLHKQVVVPIVVQINPHNGFDFAGHLPWQGHEVKSPVLVVGPTPKNAVGAAQGQVGPAVVVPVRGADRSPINAVPIGLGDAQLRGRILKHLGLDRAQLKRNQHTNQGNVATEHNH